MIAKNSNIQYHVNSITLTLSQFLRPMKETREGHEKLVLPSYLGWYYGNICMVKGYLIH